MALLAVNNALHDELSAWLTANAWYPSAKQLPTGEWAAVHDFYVTAGIVVGIALHDGSYRSRYCYEHRHEAEAALAQWDGTGDPPGPWIKQKPEERLGPGAIGKF